MVMHYQVCIITASEIILREPQLRKNATEQLYKVESVQTVQ